MLQVGQRIDWHCVFFEEIVDLNTDAAIALTRVNAVQ